MSIGQSRTLGPTSDLVVRVPWKDGIIDADEAILPSTRFALTFRAIFQIRKSAREATESPAFSDPIERLEQVHSFRMAAQADGMLLAVTYDFGWEAYMRALWHKAGPFLDLLLCNCKDYGLARATDLDRWSAWVRKYEIAADYFYVAYPLTVPDMQGLAQAEAVQRNGANSVEGDLKLADFSIREADAAAADVRRRRPELATTQALRILSAMHRLTRYYGADIKAATPLAADAETLLRATHGLLEGWDLATISAAGRASYARELAWFKQIRPKSDSPITTKAAPKSNPDLANVQRGILSGFDRDGRTISHGALLHLMVVDPKAARRALGTLSLANEAGDGAADGVFRNIAFSHGGLARLGLPAAMLEALPVPFREGAAARAGSVGDVRAHHSTWWRRLPQNWLPGVGFRPEGEAVIDLAVVDAVVQLRTHAPGAPVNLADAGHPLLAAIDGFATRFPGWALLSVEALNPAHPDKPGNDHFGFRDGISQPIVDMPHGKHWSDTVPASDLLLGYRGVSRPDSLPLRDSSFFAIRRMPMRAAAFEAILTAGAIATGIDRETIAAKIVGRQRDGTPLVPHASDNDFDFASDPDGAMAPRQSHVRRLNPRTGDVPRIVRRGMGFGSPASGRYAGDAAAERGIMFMAYCADLAEQYEVLLRWMNGGNSSRLGSWLGDPLCGVPDADAVRTFRFRHKGKVCRVALPPADTAHVELSWSLYLLAPSLHLVRHIATLVPDAPMRSPVPDDRLETARRLIKDLLACNAAEAEWRNWLDEPSARDRGMQAAFWQVIRDDHGGVLRAHDASATAPPGQDLVLVGRHDAILAALRDDGTTFSVRGAGRRMARSVEKFHLGLDSFTADYQREGPACNAAIAGVSEAEAFAVAREAAATILRQRLGSSRTPVRVDIVKQLLEPALAAMAPRWFGLPDGRFIAASASDWRDIRKRKAQFPGDFWNSSRHAFNPFESAETARLSALHGQAILKAAHGWIAATGRAALTGSITRALATAPSGAAGERGLAYPGDHDLARGVVGAMLGWVATTLGNGARLFDAWTSLAILQRKQIGWLSMPARDYDAARRLFDADMKATISRAPVPECKWREAVVDTAIGGKPVAANSKIILGLASAAAQCPADSHIWFGQAPPGAAGTPHGCPGRDMALGVLLGVAAALCDTALVRASGARLEIEISPLRPAMPTAMAG